MNGGIEIETLCLRCIQTFVPQWIELESIPLSTLMDMRRVRVCSYRILTF